MDEARIRALEAWNAEVHAAIRQMRDEVVRMVCNTPKEYEWPAMTALAQSLIETCEGFPKGDRP